MVCSFKPVTNPIPLVSELPLKLARKCLDTFGMASFDADLDSNTISEYTE